MILVRTILYYRFCLSLLIIGPIQQYTIATAYDSNIKQQRLIEGLMLKTQFLITLVFIAIIIAILSHGIIAAAFSLLAFSLLFYFVSTQKNDKPPHQ